MTQGIDYIPFKEETENQDGKNFVSFFGCKLHDQNLGKLSTKRMILGCPAISKDKGIHLSGITWKGGPESRFHYPSLSLLLSGSLPCFLPLQHLVPGSVGTKTILALQLQVQKLRDQPLVFTLSFSSLVLLSSFFLSLPSSSIIFRNKQSNQLGSQC